GISATSYGVCVPVSLFPDRHQRKLRVPHSILTTVVLPGRGLLSTASPSQTSSPHRPSGRKCSTVERDYFWLESGVKGLRSAFRTDVSEWSSIALFGFHSNLPIRP